MKKILCSLIIINLSCDTGNLIVIADLPNSLKEVSAVEITTKSGLFWVIEDAGNKNTLYGLNEKGKIIKKLIITNAKNKDWEDLTSDINGNIYIGDFGNNNKNRNLYTILKVTSPEKVVDDITAEHINFTIPKSEKPQDFEAFFLMDNTFYIFSKNNKHSKLFKVPNSLGTHEATFIKDFNLKGKNNAITSADYENGQIALLNHEKVWIINNYKNEIFFEGDIRTLEFNHKSQKEGVCFKNASTLIITDEQNENSDSNIYQYLINY